MFLDGLICVQRKVANHICQIKKCSRIDLVNSKRCASGTLRQELPCFFNFTHRLVLKNFHSSVSNSLLVLRWESGKASRRLKTWDRQERCNQWFGKLREFNRLYIFVSMQDLSTGDKGKYSLWIVWNIRRRTWSRTCVNLNP